MVRTPGFHPGNRGFDSHRDHHFRIIFAHLGIFSCRRSMYNSAKQEENTHLNESNSENISLNRLAMGGFCLCLRNLYSAWVLIEEPKKIC